MQLKNERPPNFDAIVAAFPTAANPGVLFCYGSVIFNPTGLLVPKVLIAHEEVHSEQQKGPGVEYWWERYIKEIDFRFEQELSAHIAEYKFFKKRHDNMAKRREYLDAVARRLSSPLYGDCVSYEEARRIILAEAKKK